MILRRIFNPLQNQRGSMIVNAIATSVIVAIVSGVILQESLSNVRSLRGPRVKAAMALVEGRLRSALLQPSSFKDCNSDASNSYTSCNIVPGLAAALKEQVVGCNNGVSTDCGVIVTGLTYSKDDNRTVTATISYEGTEVAIKPVPVSIQVPAEVLTSVRILCPPAAEPNKFLFKGFTSDGEKICEAPAVSVAPALNDGCPSGYYMKSFDQNTLAIQCAQISMTSVPATPCTANQMIQSLTFDGISFIAMCANRPAPSFIPDFIQPGPL